MLDPKNTIVIADFDGTINKKNVNGKRITSFASLIQHNVDYMTLEGVQIFHSLAERYHPIEMDPTVSLEEKSKYMQEWWEQCYVAYKQYHVTKRMIAETCNSPFFQLRDGLQQFFEYLTAHHVPLIIYSANALGIESIQMVLETHHLSTSNVRICSNNLLFDKEGNFIKVIPPIITSANKTGETLIKNHFLSQTPKERCCLLVGDGLNDIRMTEGIHFDKVYTVAFADTESSAFTERFDLVLPMDTGYEPISALFK